MCVLIFISYQLLRYPRANTRGVESELICASRTPPLQAGHVFLDANPTTAKFKFYALFSPSMSGRLYLRTASAQDRVIQDMQEIGVCQEGVDIMAPKSRYLVFMTRELDPRGANVLKQEMLAVGGEAAISYDAISDLSKPTDALIMGTERQFQIAIGKLRKQPFGLKEMAEKIEDAVETSSASRNRTLACGNKELRLGERTLVMGILNVTPDSFSDGGKFLDHDIATEHAKDMIEQGADIIDVGGESTRPGAEPVSLEEELGRAIPVIEALSDSDVPISIDTRKPEVLKKAVEAGASMVNVVGGLRDDDMIKVAADAGIPVVIMHMLGEPGAMQNDPVYSDVMDDIVDHLGEQIERAVDLGVKPENFIVDPGIGFGKTVEHNLEIIGRLGELRILGAPVLVGTSRKSFIGKISGGEADQRREGSLASMVLAAANGADIVRVHDVGETKKALAVADAIYNNI